MILHFIHIVFVNTLLVYIQMISFVLLLYLHVCVYTGIHNMQIYLYLIFVGLTLQSRSAGHRAI